MADESKAFFEQMNTCRPAYWALADCFAEVMSASIPEPKYALDIGCGTGLIGERLMQKNVRYTGWDSPEAIKHSLIKERLWAVDLRTVEVFNTFDVVICTETGEHLEEQYADHLVSVVAGSADHQIIWSAAVPGQEWEGHVNLQPVEYWIQKFNARGWRVHGGKTQQLRGRMMIKRAQHWHAKDNFHVLVR